MMFVKLAKTVLAGCIAAGLVTGSAAAQQPEQSAKARSTPSSFPWTYDKDGKIVRKSRAVTEADGRTREETIRGGTCVRIKEKTVDGIRWVDKC
jgi:hypothetical protein